jgi:hypothetical protein
MDAADAIGRDPWARFTGWSVAEVGDDARPVAEVAA